MISNSWTDAPAVLSAEGLVVRPRSERRAPEAFTAPYQGTGLPFGGFVVDTVVAPAPVQLPATGVIATDKFHIDAMTLGNHSSRRPPG